LLECTNEQGGEMTKYIKSSLEDMGKMALYAFSKKPPPARLVGQE